MLRFGLPDSRNGAETADRFPYFKFDCTSVKQRAYFTAVWGCLSVSTNLHLQLVGFAKERQDSAISGTSCNPNGTLRFWRNNSMMPQERRISTRKTLDHLVYLSLVFNNGGTVIDVSEGGLGFHSVAPVKANEPIHFRFAIDSAIRIRAVGELAWI